jgi:dTDP-4-amino-4,6-dideoxygalactose transaminase
VNAPTTIALSAVHVDEESERLVLDVLRSGHLAQGPMVARLESAFATLCGVQHAVAVTNGTVALVAAMQVLGLEPGDEVVTSPFTFVATLNAILECGAVARFADIDPRTFTVDAAAVADAIVPRTRALMPVHLYGQPADMASIAPLAMERGLVVVEDAAQAHGATVDGRAVGSFGLGCFSFYATKNVTSGEGGMITTDDDLLADTLRVLRNEGMRARYEYERAGHNYRLTDVQAAIAVPQLAHLRESNERRRSNAARLDEGLADIPGLLTPIVAPGRTHVFHQYTVRVTPESRLNRDELAGRLAARGIETGVYYPRVVHDYDCYRSHPRVVATPVPEAELAAREVLSFPVHPALSANDVDRIVEVVRTALGE